MTKHGHCYLKQSIGSEGSFLQTTKKRLPLAKICSVILFSIMRRTYAKIIKIIRQLMQEIWPLKLFLFFAFFRMCNVENLLKNHCTEFNDCSHICSWGYSKQNDSWDFLFLKNLTAVTKNRTQGSEGSFLRITQKLLPLAKFFAGGIIVQHYETDLC